MYSYTSEKTELLNLLRQKFQQGIKRVAFVFHDPSVIQKAFLDNTVFFNDSDLEENQTTFSENVTFLKDLVNEFNIEHYDFLACNTLQYTIWKQYYDLLHRLTNVKCGASNDKTGNIQYGADWVMENTNENVKNIYFTVSIDNYASTLAATTISSNGGTIYIQYTSIATGLQYRIGSSGSYTNIGTDYPINIENTGTNILTVQFATDLTITNAAAYFVCASSYITFDGSVKGAKGTVAISSVTSYPGLIQNGTSGLNGFHSITVQNIQTATLSGTESLASSGGWICQSSFGKNIKTISGFNPSTNYILINNCSNSGPISSGYAGGICGSNFGQNGTITISSCSNTGAISVYSAGGICGSNAGSDSGTVTISNCSNSGAISGSAGGICGSDAGYTNGTVTISSCSNTGNMTSEYSGGICGPSAGSSSGTVTISNCSNTGTISGYSAGGICALNAGNTYGRVTISNCSNTGLISEGNVGGICGSNAGYYYGTVTISGCSNTGNITRSNAGGICGAYAGYYYGTATISNCSNSGNMTDSGGGICGSDAGYYYGTATISSCSNSGNMTSTNAGGICGSNAGTSNGTATISSCSNSGTISGAYNGGICSSYAGSNSGTVTISSCFNIGEISGIYSGGITGAFFGVNTNKTCSITNSYSTGSISISASNSGGICGPNVGHNTSTAITPVIQITKCYTLGSIATTCGGILGGTNGFSTYDHNPIVSLDNCYTNGAVTDTNSGLIADSLPIKSFVIVLNCYIGNNAWTDSAAKAALTGEPTSVTTGNPGTTWTSRATNTPYILSAFNSQLYDPNSIVTTTDSYTSSQGLIQSGYTYSIVNSNKLPAVTLNINASDGILTFSGLVDSEIVTNVIASKYDSNGNPYNYNVNTFTLTYSYCFKEDSKILCLIENEEMYVKVQDLKPNMLVKTCEETYVPIDTIGYFHLVNEIDNETNRHPDGLYELTNETYPELTENLVLTGRHSILLDTLKNEHLNGYKFARHIKLYNKYKLPCVANENAKPYKNGTFKIWSFCLQAEDEKKNYGIYANGLLVESTNKMAMKNSKLNLVK
jgi:hypothetical protein